MKHLILLALLLPMAASAADEDYTLVLSGHRFEPSELTVPSGRKIRLIIENRDESEEEFDSHALGREKLIAPNSRVTLYIGPLDAGRYPFDGELHEDTAKGVIIAR